MTDTLIHGNIEDITATPNLAGTAANPPTVVGMATDFALKNIAARLGPFVAQSDGTKASPNLPGGGAGRTAGDHAIGASGGIVWRDHFDHTEAAIIARVDTTYGADVSDGITGTLLTNANKVYGDGSASSGNGDGLRDVPLGVTAYGGKQTGSLDDSQQCISTTNQTGGAGYVQVTFTTDSTNPGVHGGTDTVDHVEAYVFYAHDVDLLGSGETFASAPVEVFDTPGMLVQAEDYAEVSPTKVGTLAAKNTAYTSTTHITVSAGLYDVVLVPVMNAGGDNTNQYVGPAAQVQSTAS